ncbi:Fe(3+) ABC transporter substrate-binding protein [Microaerobacter geothermalis]|uniref:Fe(3+) ABC transporter substrate-binding protein n=1 Tax=Microaerobacter geothermalis TaxID=674972 RepID=UPI001F253918|nr:Fe(3+) ABC transporter substrate-binding protein [Microaerobacter geothermalis]MCF6094056.1 Fe(3+) ABC transporter substrate-binding protein [Microaerobacter geothermalis]
MKKQFLFLGAIFLVALLVLAGCSGTEGVQTTESSSQANKSTSNNEQAEDKGVVNLYTSRHYDTDAELYKIFTEQTGIKVNVVQGKGDELMERLDREGANTEADVFMTADAGNLYRLKERGLLQAVESKTLAENIPEQLRDVDNQWFGLTKRARVIAYAKDRVSPSELSTYENLTDPKWKGRILVRSSSNIYNQSLLASFIELNGEEKAKEWAKGIVANMARNPKGGDTDQIKALVAGEGDIAIVNTYYYARLLNSSNPEDVKIAEKVGVFFPNQQTNGTHINISGVGVTRYAKNKENAVKFIEFLSSVQAQGQFAEGNNEYPVNPAVPPSDLLKSWGDFKAQDINLTILGVNNAQAIKIFNEVGWK